MLLKGKKCLKFNFECNIDGSLSEPAANSLEVQQNYFFYAFRSGRTWTKFDSVYPPIILQCIKIYLQCNETKKILFRKTPPLKLKNICVKYIYATGTFNQKEISLRWRGYQPAEVLL